MKFILHK